MRSQIDNLHYRLWRSCDGAHILIEPCDHGWRFIGTVLRNRIVEVDQAPLHQLKDADTCEKFCERKEQDFRVRCKEWRVLIVAIDPAEALVVESLAGLIDDNGADSRCSLFSNELLEGSVKFVCHDEGRVRCG